MHRPFTRTIKFTNENCHNIKILSGYITIYTIISGWYTIPIIAWCKGVPPAVQALVRTATLSRHKSDMFPDTGCPEKKRSIRKGALLNLLTTDILQIVDMWLIGIEHHKNLNSVVAKINGPINLVLFVGVNQALEFIIFFRNFSRYHLIKYQWAYRRYVKYG